MHNFSLLTLGTVIATLAENALKGKTSVEYFLSLSAAVHL